MNASTKKLLERPPPFGALLGASSLIVAILYVAGFAYRWSYYYNFGVQHLVYDLNFQSFLITAIELIRRPSNILLVLLVVVCPLLIFNGLLYLLRRTGLPSRSKKTPASATMWFSLSGLGSPLVVDVMRATLIVYTTYMLSSQLGYITFKEHIVNSPANPLPAVTVIFPSDQSNTTPAFTCGVPPGTPVQLIGDAKNLRLLQAAYRTCNVTGVTWRLLYRDKQSIIVFASTPPESAQGRRPLTLVLPSSAQTYLMMQ